MCRHPPCRRYALPLRSLQLLSVYLVDYRTLAAADKLHDLEAVALFQHDFAIGRARHDLKIEFNRNLLRRKAETLDEAQHRHGCFHLAQFTVHREFHRISRAFPLRRIMVEGRAKFKLRASNGAMPPPGPNPLENKAF